MPFNIEMNTSVSKSTVLSSKTIELIAAFQLLADSKHHEFARAWATEIYNKLSKESINMLTLISNTNLQGLELAEFVLQWRVFDDIDKFIEIVYGIDNKNFIYRFLGEELAFCEIEQVINRTLSLESLINEKPWITRGDRALKMLFYETKSFKSGILQLLKEIAESGFIEEMNKHEKEYENAVEGLKVKSLSRDPRELVQEVIKKKWNIKQYKEYIFVPSYFISPHHLMVHNKDTLITIYDMRNISDKRQQAGERIISALSILTDKSRLEILRHLISEPSYGKILAAMLNLTTATVSHHLEMLKSVNLVKEYRVKNIKYLSANIEEIDKLLDDLKDYLYNK